MTHIHMHAQDPFTRESWCVGCHPDRPIPVMAPDGTWQDANKMAEEELQTAIDSALLEAKWLTS